MPNLAMNPPAHKTTKQPLLELSMHAMIDETERGILHRNGKAERWLEPGLYRFWSWSATLKVTHIPLSKGYCSWTPEIHALMPANAGVEVVVESHQAAVLTIDGNPTECLSPGRYILWQLRARVQVALFDMREPVAVMPEAFAALLLKDALMVQAVAETERGLLILDGKPAAWLDAGKHYIWKRHRKVEVRVLDLEKGFAPWTPELNALKPEGVSEEVTIEPHQGAVIKVGGKYTAWLEAGRWVLWQVHKRTQAILYDLNQPFASLDDAQAKVVPSTHLGIHQLADHERGVLVVNGKVAAWLGEGKHRIWQRDLAVSVRRIDLSTGFCPFTPELQRLVPPAEATRLTVAQDEIAIIYRSEQLQACVPSGHYLLWQVREPVRADTHSVKPIISTIPENCWACVPSNIMTVHTIHPYERGLLYVDGQLQSVLDAGRHALNVLHRSVRVEVVDLREQELQIVGQEIMTADKITLRVNLIVKFRVVDPVLSVQQQTALRDTLYSEAQMAARRYVAGASLDRLLESRLEARTMMSEQLAPRTATWGVEILQIDLKDVILPGDMKHLLNQVLEAEKKASATLITRREEIAATRSQINTARMMDHHPTLMRLKELDVLREVASKIEHLTVVTSTEQLIQHLRPSALPPKSPSDS